MSLREAVLAIADEMEGEAACHIQGGPIYLSLMSYVKHLRLVVKASEGECRIEAINPMMQNSLTTANRETERKLKQDMELAARMDGSGPKMIELVEEGSDTTTVVDMPGDMPIGARTLIAGKVYQLKADNRLHYDHEQTERHRGQREENHK